MPSLFAPQVPPPPPEWANHLLREQNYFNAMQNQRFDAVRNQQLLNQYLLAQPSQLRIVTIGKSPEFLFWQLPQVVFLVERIPSAKVVLKPEPMTALYLDGAKREGFSLKRQCDELGIPWSSRKLKPEQVSVDVVKMATILKPSTFVQAAASAPDIHQWGARLLWLAERGAKDAILEWAAWNQHALTQDDSDYILTLESIPMCTKAGTIKERSHEWHERQHMVQYYGGDPTEKADPLLWPDEIECDGYQVVGLKTRRQFHDEGSEQRHCVRSRFEYAKRGMRVYYSIRQGNRRLATVEYSGDGEVTEIKAFANRAPSAEVKKVAEKCGHLLAQRQPAKPRAIVENHAPERRPQTFWSRLIGGERAWEPF